MKKIHMLMAGMMLCALTIMPMHVHAEINSAEQRIINVVNATYVYNGIEYRITDEYRSKVRAYLDRDDIDMTNSEASDYISQFYDNIGVAIAQGYMEPISKPSTTPSEEPGGGSGEEQSSPSPTPEVIITDDTVSENTISDNTVSENETGEVTGEDSNTSITPSQTPTQITTEDATTSEEEIVINLDEKQGVDEYLIYEDETVSEDHALVDATLDDGNGEDIAEEDGEDKPDYSEAEPLKDSVNVMAIFGWAIGIAAVIGGVALFRHKNSGKNSRK